ncbi:MAG: ABC transporter permease subunit [Clostridiales Family XIII bacterium]|nr:ABC transporter permease subunit [Clostridiales Family XIII bacterium]
MTVKHEGARVERRTKIQINNPSSFRNVKLFFLGFFLLSFASLLFLELDLAKVAARLPKMGNVLSRLAILSFDKLDILLKATAESVSVTVLSVFYSIVPSMILGAFMASNIIGSRAARAVISWICSIIRAIPTTVWVLIILACLGFGPAAGIIGMCFHTLAFLARAFQQSFENVPEGNIEALKSGGASRVRIFFQAILPGALSNMISWCAIRFESNFSESTILGMVGAGGVGYTVMACMNGYEYGRAGTAVLVILLLSFGLEALSIRLKKNI